MGFLEITLHILSILFSVSILGGVLYIFSVLFSLVLTPFLPYLSKVYTTVIKPVLSWVLNPIVRVLNFITNKIKPYLTPLLLWVYNSFYTAFLQVYRVILLLYSCYVFVLNTAKKYLYITYNTNTIILKIIFIIVCVFGIFSCVDMLVVDLGVYRSKKSIHEDIEILTTVVYVQTYILYCFLYGYVYIFFTHISKYIDPIKWLMFVIAITAAVIPTINIYLQVTIYTVLLLALLEPLFNISGLYIYSYTYFQKNTISVYRHTSSAFLTYFGGCISLFQKQIQWVPVFKKSSYLGLYKSFKNKWPF